MLDWSRRRTTFIGFWGLALVLWTLFFLINDFSETADTRDIFWRFSLTKAHLARDGSLPYYTPGKCGGFLLAADA